MTKVTKFIGIDISKATFDTAEPSTKGYKTHKYQYDTAGMESFIATVGADSWCVMESTGVYHLRLAFALHEAGIAVSVVNPLSAKRFMQSKLARSKNDRVDACRLAEYGEAMQPEAWKPQPAYYTKLQQLLNTQAYYTKECTAVGNQIEAIEHTPDYSEEALTELHETLDYFNAKLKKVDKMMQTLVKEHDDHDIERLESIPGIGKKTAVALVVATKGMHEFSSPKQLTAYFGLAPSVVQSGTSVRGTRRICKVGMASMRKLLYMGALSAMRYNRACSKLYNRLIQNGKPAKSALIAVCNKLLKQAFAILKSQTFYDPNHIPAPVFR